MATDTEPRSALADFFEDFKDIFTGVSDTLAKQQRVLEQLQRAIQRQPVTNWIYGAPVGYGPSSGAPVVPNAGPLALLLGGPEVGRVWEIRGLGVTDAANAAATVTGTATWYVGQMVPPPAGALAGWVPVPAPSARWIQATLPKIDVFGARERVIHPTDQLFCVITSGSAGQGILAGAEILDEDVRAKVELTT